MYCCKTATLGIAALLMTAGAMANQISIVDTTGASVWSSGDGLSIVYDPALCEMSTSTLSGSNYTIQITPDAGTVCDLYEFRLVVDGREYLPSVGTFYTDLSFDDFAITAWLVDLTGCARQSDGQPPSFSPGYPIYSYTDTISTTAPVRWDFRNYPGVALIVDTVDGDVICDGAALPDLGFADGFEF